MPARLTRRGVLASTGVLPLAGCLGDGGRSNAPEGTTDPPTGTTLDQAPAVSFTVEVLRSFTDEHPAALRLALVNEGEEPLVVRWNVSDGQGGPFNAVWGIQRDGDAEVGVFRRDGSAVLCVPGDGSPVPETTADECWAPPCEAVDLPSLHGRFELSPDEPNADEYVVLDGLDGGCLQTGTYVFGGTRAGVGASVARGRVEEASVETGSEWYSLERRLTLSVAETGAVTTSGEAVLAPPGTPEDAGDSTPRPTPKPVDDADRAAAGGTSPEKD